MSSFKRRQWEDAQLPSPTYLLQWERREDEILRVGNPIEPISWERSYWQWVPKCHPLYGFYGGNSETTTQSQWVENASVCDRNRKGTIFEKGSTGLLQPGGLTACSNQDILVEMSGCDCRWDVLYPPCPGVYLPVSLKGKRGELCLFAKLKHLSVRRDD